jgi:hypothetical protein
LTLSRGEQDEQLHGLTLYAQGVPVTEELERSAVKPEVAEMIDETAQGSLLCPEIMTQCRRKKLDLKGFGASPKLHLQFTSYPLRRHESQSSFVGSRRFRPRRKGHENK